MVTVEGDITACAKLATCLRFTTPLKPETLDRFGSTAVIVIEKDCPARWLLSTVEKRKPCSTCVFTVPDEPSGIVMSDWSCAWKLKLPLEFSVTAKVRVPDWSCAAAGSVALASVVRIWTASVTVFTRFHWLSHARTVTLNGMFAVWLLGVP